MHVDERLAAFWDWAVAQYDDPELQQLLMTAQNAHGLIVLEVMLPAWLALQGARYNEPLRAAVLAAISAWHDEVLVPMRRLRERWRGEAAYTGARTHLQSLELEAERRLAEQMLAVVADNLREEGRHIATIDNYAVLLAAQPAARACLESLAIRFDQLAHTSDGRSGGVA